MVVISSMPSSPWTTSARSQPSQESTCAIGSTLAREKTPSTCRRAPAGLVSGPSRLNTVRTPSARRTGATAFIAGWSSGAKRKAMPTVSSRRAGHLRLDLDLDAERGQHVGAARARRDRAVAVLGDRHAARRRDERRRGRDVEGAPAVAAGAAGVDHRSSWCGTRRTRSRIASAAPAISCGVSPFIARATSSAAICESPTSPSMMRPNSAATSSRSRCSPASSRLSAAPGSLTPLSRRARRRARGSSRRCADRRA